MSDERCQLSAAGVASTTSTAKSSWTKRTTIAPSPTAVAQRLTDPARTSPAAKTPGTLVGGGNSPAQAAIWVARGGALVTLFHRRADLGETMSDYLIRDLERAGVLVRGGVTAPSPVITTLRRPFAPITPPIPSLPSRAAAHTDRWPTL